LPQLQRQCVDLARIISFLENNELPQDGKLARQTVYEAPDYFFKDDVLYHQQIPSNKNLQKHKPILKQIAVPVGLRTEILRNYHDDQGHAGGDRLYMTMREKYFWPTMYADVRQYVKTCIACQKAKRDYHPQKSPLQPLPVTDLFSKWQIDIVGPFPLSAGCRYMC
jgi:hypothetical protein